MTTRIYADLDGNKKIDNWEQDVVSKEISKSRNENFEVYGDGEEVITGKYSELKEKMGGRDQTSEAGANRSPKAVVESELSGSQKVIDELTAQIRDGVEDGMEEQVLAQKQSALQSEIRKAERNSSFVEKKLDTAGPREAAGMENGTFAMKAGTAGSGYKAGVPDGESEFANLGRGGYDGPSPSAAMFMKSIQLQDNKMQAFDDANAATNRGKELMLMFYTLAKMAQSGDINAIFEFVRFLGYISSKSESSLIVKLGKKMIAWNALQKKWVDKLTNQKSDPNNPDSSNELMKMMTLVKSETDAIGTATRMLSQQIEAGTAKIEQIGVNLPNSVMQTMIRIGQTLTMKR